MQFPLIARVIASVIVVRTRAEFVAKTGTAAPPFDWSRPRKTWFDNRKFEDMETEVEYFGIRYDPNGQPLEKPGQPGVIDARTFKLYPELAATVNLLPEPMPPESLLTAVQKTMMARQVPEPLALLPGERIVPSRNIGSPAVIDDGKGDAPLGSSGFTQVDRDLLKAIATKVGL